MTWDVELTRGLVTLLAVVVGGYVSGKVALRSAELQADRADRQRKVQAERDALTRRFDLQVETYSEYMTLVVKYQRSGGLVERSLRGGMAEHDKREGRLQDARLNSIKLHPKLTMAFGSDDFASQAIQVLQGVAASAHLPLERELATMLCAQFRDEMLKCIRDTETQLGLPPPVSTPNLPFPQEEFTRLFRRAHLTGLARKTGFDRGKMNDLLNKIEQDEEARPKEDKAES